MPTYAKCTVATFVVSINQRLRASPDFDAATAAKMKEMILAEKTDGQEYVLSETQLKRVWVDQAAAEEWVTFLNDLKATYGYNGHSIEILDNI